MYMNNLKRKRILLVIFVFFTHVSSYSQDNSPVIIGKDYIYALFSVEKQGNYPILFAAILDSKDTLCINTHSVNSCIMNVYKKAKSAPVMAQEYYNTFYEVFEKKSIIHHLCERFTSEFEYMFSKHCLSQTFKLNTGETMLVRYARYVGLIAITSCTSSLSIGLNTTEYPFLKERHVPLSMLECMKAEGFVTRIMNDQTVL